jgi:hypothetical protein
LTIGDWEYFRAPDSISPTNDQLSNATHIRSKFGIASNINATLDVSNPPRLHQNEQHRCQSRYRWDHVETYPWTGIYFSNIPVTMKAIANPGFVFSHWTGASTSTNPEITLPRQPISV